MRLEVKNGEAKNAKTTPLAGTPIYVNSGFIKERTPSKNREDVWELMESVGLDYYDRFEWLLRTPLRASIDNLIVEKKE